MALVRLHPANVYYQRGMAKPKRKPSKARPAAKTKAKKLAPKAKAKAKPRAKPALAEREPSGAFVFSVDDLDSMKFTIADSKPDAATFAPGTLVDRGGGIYAIVYSQFPRSPELEAIYRRRNLDGKSRTWHALVVCLLRQHAPHALATLQLAAEPNQFSAASSDLEALRAVSAALAQLENRELVAQLVSTVEYL